MLVSAMVQGSENALNMAGTLIVSILALCISAVSFAFSRRSWRETYRPIITVRVATAQSGNVASLYNLVVENTGNRPAKDIHLEVDPAVLKTALNPACTLPLTDIQNCFDPQYTIPILANGKSVSTAFGRSTLDSERTWIYKSRFPIKVKYSDLEGRPYCSEMTLFIFWETGFAGFAYCDSSKHD